MGLLEQMQTDVDNELMNTDDFGEEVTYTPVTGAATTPVVVAQGGHMEVGDTVDGRGEQKRKEFQISKTDLAAPAQGDAITHDGTVWKVQSWREGGALWILACVRTDEEEVAGENYRA